jgi:hypothetical protein
MLMRRRVTIPAEPQKVPQPVRIRPTTATNVVDLRHRLRQAELADTPTTLMDLTATLRIHRITLPPPI